MKQKIIARLKAKYSGVNLSNARLDAIADKLAAKITDENEIDAKLDELNEIVPFADMAKQDDRVRTLEAQVKKTDPVDPAKPKTEDVKVDTADMPEWAKAMAESNKALLAKIEGLETKQTAEANMATVVAKLAEKKIPESFYELAIEGRIFKTSEESDAFATKLIEKYEKHHASDTTKSLTDPPPPVMGAVTDSKTEVSPMMKGYLKERQDKQNSSNTKTA